MLFAGAGANRIQCTSEIETQHEKQKKFHGRDDDSSFGFHPQENNLGRGYTKAVSSFLYC